MRWIARKWTIHLLFWTIGIGSAMIGVARSQTPAFNWGVPTSFYSGVPTPERITAWLHSAEGRDRAWGAYYVVQTKYATFLPELVKMAEQWEPLPTHGDSDLPPGKGQTRLEPEQVDRLDAMTAVLDAVILLNGQISAQGLLKLQGDFPAQTAVLLSRMPEPEAEPTLLAMVNNADHWHGEQRRMAAELLARTKTPPAGFVASLMRGVDVGDEVTVDVPSKPGALSLHRGGTGITGGISFCDADIAVYPPQSFDWPQVGQYSLRTYLDAKYATSYPIARGILVARIEVQEPNRIPTAIR